MTLDELRAAHSDLGFAVYAMTPGGAVTFEIYTPDGQVFQYRGLTEQAAIAEAFPSAPVVVETAPSIFD